MNMNQFTQRSLAAIQGAQELAVEHGNQQIEQEHLMLALLTDEQGFIPQLLSAMGMTVPSFAAARRRWRSCPSCRAGAGRRTRSMWPRMWTGPSRPLSPRPSP